MKKLTFEQLKKLPQYKVAHKVYYKKYPFCVRFNEDIKITSYYDHRYTSWISTARERKKWILKNINHSHRSRFDCHAAFYFEDISDVAVVFEKFKDEITTIEAPVNENHKDTIVSDLNITTRKSLFYKEYRYKIQLYSFYRGYYKNAVSIDDLKEFLSLCKDFDDGSYKLNSFLSTYSVNGIRPYYGSGAVFLKNYEDVCALHLIHKNIILSTTKIILIDELE